MTDGVIVGLDVGGTKVAGGLVTASNGIIERRDLPTPLIDGLRDPGLGVTTHLARELVEAALALGLRADGIGAGFPEFVDPTGRLRSHEVLAWTEQPRTLLESIAPVSIDSDVRCAALGEAASGIARGLESFAFVVVGTGLSYALVESGRARPGVRGEAIALGELEVSRSVDPSTTLSLERYASGEAIRERYVAASGRSAGGAADVFERATDGDFTAGSIVESAARAVGRALAVLVSIVDPGAIVLGGGVSNSGDRWRATVETSYEASTRARPDAPPVLWATLGSDAGIIGAAISHRNRLRASEHPPAHD